MAFQSRPALFCAAAAVASVVLATPAFAHHSAGAFDRTKEMTVTGTVKAWRWTNPHPSMTIVADKSAPAAGDYVFEYPAPVQMQDRGWTRNLAKVGDKVKVAYSPWRAGNPGGLFKDITGADGRSLKAREQASR